MSRASQSTPETELENLGGFSPRAVFDLLFSVAGPKLGRADLLAIVKGGAEFTEQAAGCASRVTEGVGCLVSYEANNPAHAGSGSFQDGTSVAELMFHMKAHLAAIEGISAAVGWAAQELSARGSK